MLSKGFLLLIFCLAIRYFKKAWHEEYICSGWGTNHFTVPLRLLVKPSGLLEWVYLFMHLVHKLNENDSEWEWTFCKKYNYIAISSEYLLKFPTIKNIFENLVRIYFYNLRICEYFVRKITFWVNGATCTLVCQALCMQRTQVW